jgi:membrane glycosyltransferase
MTRIFRRSVFYSLTIFTTLLAMALVAQPFLANDFTVLEFFLILIFGILIFGVSLSFWMAIIGFFVLLTGGDRKAITKLTKVSAENILSMAKPIALVMPICNENPQRIFAGLRAIYESVLKTGFGQAFEIFVLSDTSDPLLRLQEEQLWFQMCEDFQAHGKIFYRNRIENVGRKSGNIAEFCQHWGGRYEFMILLDADSLMDGNTLVKMVNIMQAQPKVAILQTPPLPVNQKSLFGRVMQFASCLYGQIYSAGAAFWQLSQSNYWGHNAIIRVEAFAAHASLPKLPGEEPLGGEILSHDFVEAALLREAGWEVWLAYDIDGSYEEMPTNIIDYAKRDRRWCQGNLQHIWFLFAKKMSLVSRLHLLMGVMAYLASPLWLVFLIITGVAAYEYGHLMPIYFAGNNPFPVWPISYDIELVALLLVTLGMLFIPKLLSLLWLLCYPQQVKKFGGYLAVIASVLLECIFSTLLAPLLMLYRTKFVLAILLRQSIGWPAQQREEHGLSFKEAVTAHGIQTLIGFLALLGIYFFIPNFFWWFLPAVLGLIFSVPLSMLVSSSALGAITRRWHLFCTPEETCPPEIIQLFQKEMQKD